MSDIHNEFEKTILKCRFRKDYSGECDYIMFDGTWFYKLNFEGYAYVLYQQINIYVKPLMKLFRIYNKFKQGSAQINLHYDVPIAHFRDPKKLTTLMEIITDKLEDE